MHWLKGPRKKWIVLWSMGIISVLLVAWAVGQSPREEDPTTEQKAKEDRTETTPSLLPNHLLQYPGSTLQQVQLWPLGKEETVVSVILMFATDDPQKRVVNYYMKLMEPYGKVLEHVGKGYYQGRITLFVEGMLGNPFVEIVRAAKSDLDPEDGFTRVKDPKEEETKITWHLFMPIPEWE